MQNTILVMGATGKLGVPVALHLKKEGFLVRIMTRDKHKARKLFDESFEIVEGDALDFNSLDNALDGSFGVHMSISPPKIEPLAAKKVVSIAMQKGVQRITYVSGTNNSEENARSFYIARIKLATEKVVLDCGIPYTIFCPTATMENIPAYVQGKRASVFGKQPHPLHWYAADDFGRMVAASYRNAEAVNKRLFVHGPEAILTHDAVRRYCSVFHPEIKDISTLPFWIANIIATLSRNKDMKLAVAATSFYEKVGEAGDPTEANRILGSPTTTLDEWLKMRKAKLQAATG